MRLPAIRSFGPTVWGIGLFLLLLAGSAPRIPVFLLTLVIGLLIWATLAYSLQIYCDFSGYTDMALGSAHLLGYKLAQNFNMPYLAANVSEFWHRWHMSLSSWLRDYLFIPLGGSRGTPRQTNRNLMITMTLGGLWHGASWTFVVWGMLHGGMLILHRLFRSFCEQHSGRFSSLARVDGVPS